ncbi:MAG TPA: mechanosensitive ion channel domain-containing protein [Sphingobium sp.]|nr:mechanosensitive ion channel domain-containing protein [Sphingobium sp.]
MDWQQWIGRLGVPLPGSPDIQSLALAVVLVAGAVVIGWFVGHRAGPPIANRLHLMNGATGSITGKLVAAVLQYGVISLLLLVAVNAAGHSPLAHLLIAIALGIAVALLAFRLIRAFGIGFVTAAVLAVIALVATTAGALGGMQPLTQGLQGAAFSVGARRITLLAVVNAVIIIALLYVIARAANRILLHLIGRASALDISQRVLVQKLAGIGVIALAVMLGIDLLGIDLTALAVFSGAAGLAVGFGLQKTFGNLIAGLILLMDRSIKPGDVIVVGETYGAVSKIGVRAISVVTRDGKEHLIPNEQLMTEQVENWSYSSRNVRVHVPVMIAYGSDVALAQRLMIEAATAAARVLTDPKPVVWLRAFGDSGIEHDILVWIDDPELGIGGVRSDILNRLWVLFTENGIEVPFPQQDIHVRSLPPGWAGRETG